MVLTPEVGYSSPLSEMTSRLADFDNKTPSDARDANVYEPAAMYYRYDPFVLCRQIYLTSVNALIAAAVSVAVSSRLASGCLGLGFALCQLSGLFTFTCCHVYDCDLVCEGQKIADAIMAVCPDIWNCEVVSSNLMLGIRRRLAHDSEGAVEHCDLDMIPFVEGMAETFREHLPKPHGGKFTTPLEPDFNITKKYEVSDSECKEVFDAGQQAGCNMVLWAARHCSPEFRVGISILCRVMARPSWKAFQGLMRVIAWMYQERCRGIRYSRDGNSIPAWLVDSSAKADPYDHKCQYGAVGLWMGGRWVLARR